MKKEAIFVLVVLLIGLPVSAQQISCNEIGDIQALPDEGFAYGWQRFVEGVDLWFTQWRGPEALADKHTQFANRRLAEACAEISKGKYEDAQRALIDCGNNVREVNLLANRLSLSKNSELRNKLQQSTAVLNTLLGRVPEQAKSGIQNAITEVGQAKMGLEITERTKRAESVSGLEAYSWCMGKTININVPVPFLPASQTTDVTVISDGQVVKVYNVDYSKEQKTIIVNEGAKYTNSLSLEVDQALEVLRVGCKGSVSMGEAKTLYSILGG